MKKLFEDKDQSRESVHYEEEEFELHLKDQYLKELLEKEHRIQNKGYNYE